MFSLIWSIGSNLVTEGRKRFNQFLLDYINNISSDSYPDKRVLHGRIPVEDELTCFDFKLKIGNLLTNEQTDEDEKTIESVESSSKYWIKWSDELLKTFILPKNNSFDEIIIPTIDKIRHVFFLDLFLNEKSIKNSSVLFVGPTGTGKSCYSSDYLMKNAPLTTTA